MFLHLSIFNQTSEYVMKRFFLIGVLSLNSLFASDLPKENLVAEYLFSGNADDSSFKFNHGTVHHAVLTKDRFGRDSKAYAFNGTNAYIEIPSDSVQSIAATGELTVSVWIRPDVLDFQAIEGENYIHWMGKGEPGKHEWVFRMYNEDSPRPNRISCYAFNLSGGLGSGSYTQESLISGEWIHITAYYNYPANQIRIYKNGVLKDTDYFTDYHVVPEYGKAPLRIGTRNFISYFQGAIDDLRIYNRALPDSLILALYNEPEEPESSKISYFSTEFKNFSFTYTVKHKQIFFNTPFPEDMDFYFYRLDGTLILKKRLTKGDIHLFLSEIPSNEGIIAMKSRRRGVFSLFWLK